MRFEKHFALSYSMRTQRTSSQQCFWELGVFKTLSSLYFLFYYYYYFHTIELYATIAQKIHIMCFDGSYLFRVNILLCLAHKIEESDLVFLQQNEIIAIQETF